MSASWDVFHSVRLEVERGVDAARVRERLLAGDLNGDDLIRPAGTVRWSRIAQVAAFNGAPPPAEAEVETPTPTLPPVPPPPVAAPPPAGPLQLRPEPAAGPLAPPVEPGFALDDEDSIEAEPVPPPRAVADLDSVEAEPVRLDDAFAFDPDDDDELVELDGPAPPAAAPAAVAAPRAEPAAGPAVLPDDEAGGPDPPELGDPLPAELEAADPVEDDPASDFTLTRNATERVEELDLAAMVDVAFQLVLFFLVTASTIVFKTLEVPKPNEDKPPDAAVQSRARTIDELEKDYILVEVDAEGGVKVDHNPVTADRAALVEKLRQARETTGRKAMLLSADFNTRHKNAVLAFDVAGEIDLQIAIAQPTGKD